MEEFKNKVFINIKEIALIFFFLVWVQSLYFLPPATPIHMTHHCSHAEISNRFLLGECTGKPRSKVDVILNLLGPTWSISVKGKVAKI